MLASKNLGGIRQMVNIHLRHYIEDDFNLLNRLVGDPSMMIYLGGPESKEKILERHQRYLKSNSCYIVVVSDSDLSVGWVGYWELIWKGEKVFETGWSILPEYQGKGFATKAMKLLLIKISEDKKYRFVHAFPSIDNTPSNRICEKIGFSFIEQTELEFPKGNLLLCNNWKLDLFSN